jgi:hypothetical protein
LEVAKLYTNDIVTTASDLGTRGTLKRLLVRHPLMAKVLEYYNKIIIITPIIEAKSNTIKCNYPSYKIHQPNNTIIVIIRIIIFTTALLLIVILVI